MKINCYPPVRPITTPASVAGLGFVCAGHVAHHMNIIKERYLGEYPAKKPESQEKPRKVIST